MPFRSLAHRRGGMIRTGGCIIPAMTDRIPPSPCPFTPRERDYIRRELDMYFSTLPAVADGFLLRTWRGGPMAGQPKVPPPLRTMIERGLMEIRTETRAPRAYFSESGIAALRLLALDRRHMDPRKFAHVRAELGLAAISQPEPS
jgi:hypothetical protein